MATNKVVYGNQTLIDLTDSTLQSSDEIINGVTAYDRSGTLLTGTANFMDLVSNPTANDILVTDANGQAIDSGVQIGNVAMQSDIPDVATDSVYGVVKLNTSESVSLNSDGQLDIGGRLGQFQGTTGIYHSKDREPRAVGDFSFLITDAKGVNLNAPRTFALLTGVNISLSKSHPAGSTTYTVTNNYANRIACAVLSNGGYLSLNESYAKENQIVPVTSVTIGGQPYVPNSSANDNTKPITITVSSSANPTSAVTQLRAFGGVTGGYCSEYIGQAVGGASGASLIIGQRVTSPSGNVNCIISADTYNTGNGNAIFGRQHISRKNRSFLAGTGHDTSNARSESVSALGEWSDLSSTETLFAIGDGTSHIDRSNAFEVRDQCIVLKSPNGTKWKITIDNSGNLITTSI